MRSLFSNADIQRAGRWQLFMARLFGRKLCDKTTDKVTIYIYKGCFYVTDWLPEVIGGNDE
jgi:hypothetical protein